MYMADFLTQIYRLVSRLTLVVASCWLLNACSSGDAPSSGNGLQNSNAFDLKISDNSTTTEYTLVEGNGNGLVIPLQIDRFNNGSDPITLTARGASDADDRRLTAYFSQQTLTANNTQTNLTLLVGIDALPIQAQQRTIIISASDGVNTDEINVVVNLQPTQAPDLYLLVGQSNMVGFSGDDTKQAYPGGADEPHPRIKQLHVTRNDEWNQFTDASHFRSVQRNVLTPAIITAEDPLHEPLNLETNSKDNAYIGLGLSFAKSALPNTSANIVLIPAAWSGSAFCDNNGGPRGQWNADPTNNPALGNTWLFDRAITRTNAAIDNTGGILRGILWHQGESDANQPCSEVYLANIERLAQQFRMRIKPDQRGGDFRRADSPIPFVLGTMSRGFDERGDLSVYSEEKQLIDNYHRQLPSQLPFVTTSVHDDLVGNQWPCGNSTCIHFGAEALREIGERYYQQLLVAMSQHSL